MVPLTRLLPVVLLCASLLTSSCVRSASIMQWVNLIKNFFRTLFYYLFPIKRRQVEAIDDSLTGLTKMMQEIMPVSGNLVHSESVNFGLGGYTCKAFGSASDFRTFEKDGKVRCTWESDNAVHVKIPYTVKNFNIHFGAFYLKAIGMTGLRTKGSLDIHVKRNRMILGVRIPNVVEMIQKFTEGSSCYVTIDEIYFEDIGDIKVNVHSTGVTGGATSSLLLTTHLNNNPEIMLEAVRVSFMVNMYRKVAGKSKTLCVGKVLEDEIIRDKHLEPKKYSDEFYRCCGQSYDDPKIILENPNPKSPEKPSLFGGSWTRSVKKQTFPMKVDVHETGMNKNPN